MWPMSKALACGLCMRLRRVTYVCGRGVSPMYARALKELAPLKFGKRKRFFLFFFKLNCYCIFKKMKFCCYSHDLSFFYYYFNCVYYHLPDNSTKTITNQYQLPIDLGKTQ